jgi:hypothetical protein
MFSAKLERRRQFNRLAVLVALAVFIAGIGAIMVMALRASALLEGTEAEGTAPIALLVAAAFAALIVLCLVVYAGVRMAGRSPPLQAAEICRCASFRHAAASPRRDCVRSMHQSLPPKGFAPGLTLGRGWRAEKRKPMVSAILLGSRRAPSGAPASALIGCATALRAT